LAPLKNELAVSSQAPPSAPVPGDCQEPRLQLRIQQEIQRDFCMRRFSGEAVRADMVRKPFQGPGGKKGEMFVYASGDMVSERIAGTGAWETRAFEDLNEAMERARAHFGAKEKAGVTFMDIGANIGSFSTYFTLAGYRVLPFEPMPMNEEVIRSNLCLNDPEGRLATLFTKGLGREPDKCAMYSPKVRNDDGEDDDSDLAMMVRMMMMTMTMTMTLTCDDGDDDGGGDDHCVCPQVNKGNGLVYCNDTWRAVDDSVAFQGRMQIVRLDDLLVRIVTRC
jgi:hypothetical protein